MKVTAKNPKSQLLPNILVSVIDDRDSVFVLTPKFTDAGNPVIFNFPEDQIHSISSKASNLVIIIEHPAIGYTTQLIPVSKVYSSSNLNIEFQLGLLPENLAVSNIRNYYLNGYLQSRSMLGIIP